MKKKYNVTILCDTKVDNKILNRLLYTDTELKTFEKNMCKLGMTQIKLEIEKD